MDGVQVKVLQLPHYSSFSMMVMVVTRDTGRALIQSEHSHSDQNIKHNLKCVCVRERLLATEIMSNTDILLSISQTIYRGKPTMCICTHSCAQTFAYPGRFDDFLAIFQRMNDNTKSFFPSWFVVW